MLGSFGRLFLVVLIGIVAGRIWERPPFVRRREDEEGSDAI